MIDYIEVIKHITGKNTFFSGYLQTEASYPSGWIKYSLKGCKELEIWFNEKSNLVKLRGSIMYYCQEHNFSFNEDQFKKAISYIGRLIKVDLWDATVKALEYGAILELEPQELPRDYIQNHREENTLLMCEKPEDKGCFRWYKAKDGSLVIKLYDVNKNIKYKHNRRTKRIIQDSGWNPVSSYLKVEVHYKKLDAVLNDGKEVLLQDLLTKDWKNRLKTDLVKQYKRLLPMKSLTEPTDKKKLSTADIIFLLLAEKMLNEGKTLEEVKKTLYSRINAISEEVLSKSNKKARKAQINKIRKRIQFPSQSRWDLSSKLDLALRGY